MVSPVSSRVDCQAIVLHRLLVDMSSNARRTPREAWARTACGEWGSDVVLGKILRIGEPFRCQVFLDRKM